MAHLEVMMKDGQTHIVEITPELEYAFEAEFNTGIYKRFRELDRQSDLYWLAWRGLQSLEGVIVKPFGIEFIKTLKDVSYRGDDSQTKKASDEEHFTT